MKNHTLLTTTFLCPAKQLWILYLRLPTSLSKDARKQRELKREVIRLRTEMDSTSSQDEFAKWAKLRRRHDKTLEEFEALSACILFSTDATSIL